MIRKLYRDCSGSLLFPFAQRHFFVCAAYDDGRPDRADTLYRYGCFTLYCLVLNITPLCVEEAFFNLFVAQRGGALAAYEPGS